MGRPATSDMDRWRDRPIAWITQRLNPYAPERVTARLARAKPPEPAGTGCAEGRGEHPIRVEARPQTLIGMST
jgi:hypothetical protein